MLITLEKKEPKLAKSLRVTDNKLSNDTQSLCHFSKNQSVLFVKHLGRMLVDAKANKKEHLDVCVKVLSFYWLLYLALNGNRSFAEVETPVPISTAV